MSTGTSNEAGYHLCLPFSCETRKRKSRPGISQSGVVAHAFRKRKNLPYRQASLSRVKLNMHIVYSQKGPFARPFPCRLCKIHCVLRILQSQKKSSTTRMRIIPMMAFTTLITIRRGQYFFGTSAVPRSRPMYWS